MKMYRFPVVLGMFLQAATMTSATSGGGSASDSGGEDIRAGRTDIISSVVPEEEEEANDVLSPLSKHHHHHHHHPHHHHHHHPHHKKDHHPYWTHGWDKVSDMMYAHGGNASVLIPEAISYLGSHYSAATFANGYGHEHSHMYQEDATIYSARQLRKINPNFKTMFYWKAGTESQILCCSSSKDDYLDNKSEYRLYDHHGNPIRGKKHKAPCKFNYTSAEFRDFWVGHLVDLAQIMDDTDDDDNSTRRPLIDGFYIDGLPLNTKKIFGNKDSCPKHCLTPEESLTEHLYALLMSHNLQYQLDQLGYNQLVIINGLDSSKAVTKHAIGAHASMVDHFGILQFINKNTGHWIKSRMEDVLFKTIRHPSNRHRTVQIKGWVGPIAKQVDHWPHDTEYPGDTGHKGPDGPDGAPSTTKGKQVAMLQYFNQVLALFLLVAEENMFLAYSWFWNMGDYVPYDSHAHGVATHTFPPGGIPEFDCKVGEPLGPPVNETSKRYLYTREYEHASVVVDLKSKGDTTVIWKESSGCADLPPPPQYVEEEEEESSSSLRSSSVSSSEDYEMYDDYYEDDDDDEDESFDDDDDDDWEEDWLALLEKEYPSGHYYKNIVPLVPREEEEAVQQGPKYRLQDVVVGDVDAVEA